MVYENICDTFIITVLLKTCFSPDSWNLGYGYKYGYEYTHGYGYGYTHGYEYGYGLKEYGMEWYQLLSKLVFINISLLSINWRIVFFPILYLLINFFVI